MIRKPLTFNFRVIFLKKILSQTAFLNEFEADNMFSTLGLAISRPNSRFSQFKVVKWGCSDKIYLQIIFIHNQCPSYNIK